MGDNPKAERAVRNIRRLYQLGFKKARELMTEGEPLNWEEQESKERYWTFLPMVAMDIMKCIAGEASMIERAPDDALERATYVFETLMTEAEKADFSVKA